MAAIDVFGPWAAVFRFSLWPNGDVDTQTDVALRARTARGRLRAGGGASLGGWNVPWRRPVAGWGGRRVCAPSLSGGSKTVEVNDDLFQLLAVCGFASATTDAVRITTPGVAATIVPAPTGAFVGVGVGHGPDFMKLTAMRDGGRLTHN